MTPGPRFVPGRDVCNQILTSRPNPTVMATTEPVDDAAEKAASPVPNRRSYPIDWSVLREQLRAKRPCPVCGDTDDPGEVIWPTTGCLTRCDTCNGTGLVNTESPS